MAMHWSCPIPNLSENVSSLAQSLDMMERNQWPVLYYTLESTVQQFTRHAYKIISGENISESAHYSAEDQAALLSGYKFYIEDKLFSNISLMRADIEENIKRYDIRIVIIDYLQLLNSGKHKNNREQEVGYILRQLQSIAREKNVLVLVSSQLSRAVEYRTGEKRPFLSDLRESGHIEQIADKVIFLYKPDIYGFTEDANGDSLKNMMELIIAKNRSGSTGSLKLHLDPETLNIKDTYKDEIEMSQWRIPSDRLSELF
jgi:replicative DNA helicase